MAPLKNLYFAFGLIIITNKTIGEHEMLYGYGP